VDLRPACVIGLRAPMHLASDFIHPYEDAGGRPAYCCVRIYLPDDVRTLPW